VRQNSHDAKTIGIPSACKRSAEQNIERTALSEAHADMTWPFAELTMRGPPDPRRTRAASTMCRADVSRSAIAIRRPPMVIRGTANNRETGSFKIVIVKSASRENIWPDESLDGFDILDEILMTMTKGLRDGCESYSGIRLNRQARPTRVAKQARQPRALAHNWRAADSTQP
jgi:hypothetical protein